MMIARCLNSVLIAAIYSRPFAYVCAFGLSASFVKKTIFMK